MSFARGVTAFALAGVLASVCCINTATIGTAYADAPIGTKASYLLGKMFNSHGNFGFLNSTSDPFTCGASDKGTVYYKVGTGAQICDGSAWGSLGSAGSTPTPQPTATPGPFVTITKTTGINLNATPSAYVQVVLADGQYENVSGTCCLNVVGVVTGTAAASASCWAIWDALSKDNGFDIDVNGNGGGVDESTGQSLANGKGYMTNAPATVKVNATTMQLVASVTSFAGGPMTSVSSSNITCQLSVVGLGTVTYP